MFTADRNGDTFTNNGQFNIASGGDLQVVNIGQTFNQDAGVLDVQGAFNPSNITFNFNGGTLAGTGTINDPVTVPAGGILAPGDPTGTLTVTNNNCTVNGALASDADTPRQQPPRGDIRRLSRLLRKPSRRRPHSRHCASVRSTWRARATLVA